MTSHRVIRNRAALGLAVVALAGSVAAGATWERSTAVPLPVTPVCESEGQDGPCFWDADEQGNGQGVSFYVDADNNVYYTK